MLWRRVWQPTPVFLPGESHGQRSLAGYSPWSCKKSGMTEQLTALILSIKKKNLGQAPDPRFSKLTASESPLTHRQLSATASISVSVGLGEGLRTCILHKFQSAALGPGLSEPLSCVYPSREVQIIDWLVLISCLWRTGRAKWYRKKLFKMCFKREHYLGKNLNILFFSPWRYRYLKST